MCKFNDLFISNRKKLGGYLLLCSGAIAALWAMSLYSYLLFHTVCEMFTIITASSIFIVTWNTRKIVNNNYFQTIGISFLFLAIIELLHTLAYKGMPIFAGFDSNLPTQLWIASRYFVSMLLLVSPFLIKRKVNLSAVTAICALITTVLLLSIFYFRVFPKCFVEGSGLTQFKVVSEYVICAIFAGAIATLWLNRKNFSRQFLVLLTVAITLNIIAEFCFTLYSSPFGSANLLGHFFVIAGYFTIYQTMVAITLRSPYESLFREITASEQALREQRDTLQHYLDVAGVMLLALNPDQTVRTINKKGCEILGTDQEHIAGKNWFDNFVPEDVRQARKENFAMLLAGDLKDREYVEGHIQTAMGKLRLIEWHHSVLKDAAGNITGTLSSGTDVTERKGLEIQLGQIAKEWEVTFDSISDPVSIHDKDFRFVKVNKACAKLFNTTPEKMVGQYCFTFFHDKNCPKDICPHCDVMNSGKYSHREIFEPKINAWLEVSAWPIFDESQSEFLGSVHIVKDITERRKAQKALDEYRERLEDMVAARTAQLQKANQSLKLEKEHLRQLASEITLVEERQRRKIAVSIHDDLGQMLAILKLQLGGIKDKASEDTVSQLPKVFEYLDQAIQYTRSLTFQLSPPVLYKFGLEAALEWLCDNMKKQHKIDTGFKDDGLQKSLPEDTQVVLFQAVRELLFNIVKHAQASKAEVSIRRHDGLVSVQVADNGVGMKEPAAEVRPTGFGLFNIHERIEYIGGTLKISAAEPHGCIITITVPVAQ